MAKESISSSDGDKPIQRPNSTHAANVDDNTIVPRPNSHTLGQEGDQQVEHTANNNTAQLNNEPQLQHPVLVASPELPPLPPAHYQLLPQPLPQEQMNALSLQDTENNNVDENSNDQHYQQYTRYHHQYSNHAFVPETSVRPRRPQVSRDELDYSLQTRETVGGQLGNPSHQRSHYENVRYNDRASYTNRREEHRQGAVPHPRHYEDSYVTTSRRASSGHNSEYLLHSQSTNHSIRNWIPLSLRGGSYCNEPPSPEETQQEARELLENFTREEILSHHLQVPNTLTSQHPSWSNPAWQNAGAELRRLADAFARTEERRQVQIMAEQVNMDSMNVDNFFRLCAELFSSPGGITRERIVALFTFVADISIINIQKCGGHFLQTIMKWSLRYICEHICLWVQQAGGWNVVLSTGLNLLCKTAIIAFAVTGTIAFVIYIYKNR